MNSAAKRPTCECGLLKTVQAIRWNSFCTQREECESRTVPWNLRKVYYRL